MSHTSGRCRKSKYIAKGYAPAIAGIWGREGGGRRRLIQIKKCVLLFAIDGVRMFEACMCTFRMAVERISTKRRTRL